MVRMTSASDLFNVLGKAHNADVLRLIIKINATRKASERRATVGNIKNALKLNACTADECIDVLADAGLVVRLPYGSRRYGAPLDVTPMGLYFAALSDDIDGGWLTTRGWQYR
jgi:hypothetical protein